jgi:hypothetical protein
MDTPEISSREQRARNVIEFAIDLAQTDLTQLRAGDWLNWREDLAVILREDSKHPRNINQDDLAALQPEIRSILEAIARYWSPTATVRERGNALKAMRFKINNIDSLTVFPDLPGPMLQAQTPLRDSLLLALAIALGKVQVSYLRQCLSCQRLFLAEHGRQVYCSHKCMQKEGTRRYREHHSKKAKKQQRKQT